MIIRLTNGTIIDRRYEITGELGAGGMGVVYAAVDSELHRTIALKLLDFLPAENEEQLARLKREASALHQINHPGVVNVFHVGMYKDKHPYLAMELLEGETLAQCLTREGSLNAEKALPIAIAVAEILAEAHRQGILHRDLKPSNIFLTREGTLTIVKVIDFGLCKPITSEKEAQALTLSGCLVGSANYMSPESCQGHAASVRSDIYSLAVVLWEMLTGKPLFDADTSIGLLFKHANEPAPRLSQQYPLFPHATACDQVLQTCLAKNPADRYQSMTELKEELEDLLAMTKQRDLGQDAARHRQWLRAGAVLAISFSLAATLWVLSPKKPLSGSKQTPALAQGSRIPRTAEQLEMALNELSGALSNKTDAQRQALYDQGLFLIDTWLKKDGRGVKSYRHESVQDCIKTQWLLGSDRKTDNEAGEKMLLKIIGESAGRDVKRELTARGRLAEYYRKVDPHKVRSITDDIYRIWKVNRRDPEAASLARQGMHQRLYIAGKEPEECRKLIEIENELKDDNALAAALASAGILTTHLITGKHLAAAELLNDHEFNLIDRAGKPTLETKHLKIMALNRKADIATLKGADTEAMQALSEAEALGTTVGLESLRFSVKCKIADCLIKLKNMPLAVSVLREATTILLASKESLHDSGKLSQLAATVATTRNFEATSEIYRRLKVSSPEKASEFVYRVGSQAKYRDDDFALKTLELVLLPEPRRPTAMQGLCMYNLGSIYYHKGNWAESIRWQNLANQSISCDPALNTYRAGSLSNMAMSFQRLNKLPDAINLQRQALDLLNTTTCSSATKAGHLCRRGYLNECSNRLKEAIQDYEHSLALLFPLPADGLGAATAVNALIGQASCSLQLGGTQRAQACLYEARALYKQFPVSGSWQDTKPQQAALLKSLDEQLRSGQRAGLKDWLI